MKPLLKFVMTSTLVINMPNDHLVVGDHKSSGSYSGCVLELGKAKSVCQRERSKQGTLSFRDLMASSTFPPCAKCPSQRPLFLWLWIRSCAVSSMLMDPNPPWASLSVPSVMKNHTAVAVGPYL